MFKFMSFLYLVVVASTEDVVGIPLSVAELNFNKLNRQISHNKKWVMRPSGPKNGAV